MTESSTVPPEPVDILLAEDNPGDIRLTEEAFKDGQIWNTLHIVTDGVEALDFLHQRGEYTDAPRPAVVLLDRHLPRKTGGEVLAELKNNPELPSLPVIVLTSSERNRERLRSNERGANAYLTKPVDPDEFIDIVRTVEGRWISIIRPSDR